MADIDDVPVDPMMSDPLMTAPTLELPALIRACRHYANLSQRELAVKVGVSKSYVGALETGEAASPTFALVQTILEVSGLRLVPIVTAFAMPLTRRQFDDERDRADRRFPSHLDVRPVLDNSDWWFSRLIPGVRQRPAFTADWDRNAGRKRRPRSAPRNTPGGSAVSGGDGAAG